jgi:hypothetical protein
MKDLAIILLLGAYLAFAFKAPVAWLSKRLYRRRMDRATVVLGALLAPYVLVTAPSIERNLDAYANDLLALAAYVYVPGALAIYRQRASKPKPKPLDLADALILLIVWLPQEFGWLPRATVEVVGEPVPVERLTGVVLLLMIFFVFRPQPYIGYTFEFKARDLKRALQACGVAVAAGALLGLVTGFFEWAPPRRTEVDTLLVQFVSIYLLAALPAELFFRGVFQNLLEKRSNGEKQAALIIAALLFGAAHLNEPPAPNYTYALLATVSGAAYGWVWMRTRKVTAAALTHALAVWVWAVFLGGPGR